MAERLNPKMKSKRTIKSDDKSDAKQDDDNDYDMSVLQKPIKTSIIGFVKALKLFQTATDEVREYLTTECDVLYECRVCRSIFRSLSNFIMHKRTFCQEKFSHVSFPRETKNDEDDCLSIIQKESVEPLDKKTDERDGKKTSKKTLDGIIEGLAQRKQFGFEIHNFSIGEFYDELNNKKGTDDEQKPNRTLDLVTVDGSSNSVFQTLKTNPELSESKPDEMKKEVMEIHSLLQGQTAILGSDGKVLNVPTKLTQSKELICKDCNVHFATRKTLMSHMKYKHEAARIMYPCLECSDTFSTIWSVYRHLYNIHRKTLSQVRKMRPQIQAKAFRRNEVPVDTKPQQQEEISSINEQQKIDEENQAWMDNFETDNDIQMCGGCGRRFERKAALNSHSQTCQKRIAARNIINVNRQKRIAASEDKSLEKRSAKIPKLDIDGDKKTAEKVKISTAKKRKSTIQIRCDYSKSDKESSNLVQDVITVNKSVEINSDSKEPNSETVDKETLDNELLTTVREVIGVDPLKLHDKIEDKLEESETVDFQEESEIVSIPSSHSSPDKEEKDPLQSDTDSEIEEILGPCPINPVLISHNENSNQESENKESRSESNFSSEQFELPNINEDTLQLIKLINPDATLEHNKFTLDERMSPHVNIKKLHCLPCDMKFSNISKLRTHMALHFRWLRFRCDICAFKAYDKINVYDHIKTDHSIQEWEKIEAIIFQLQDWESAELASDNLQSFNNNEIVNDTVPTVIVEEKLKDVECSGDITPNSCIVIEANSKNIKNRGRSTKKCKGSKILKVKKKIEEVIDNDIIIKDQSNDSSKSDINCQSDNDRSSSRTDSLISQDDALKKMVYEVIFGHNMPTKSNSITDEKDTKSLVSSAEVVSNVLTRPVRNRVKPLNKDFIYDLNEFKELSRTVLPSNNNRNFLRSEYQISEPLEEPDVKHKKISKITPKTVLSSCPNVDGRIRKLNLERNSDLYKSNNDDTIVDNDMFLNDGSGTSQSSVEDDHDIYIVENEKLVAVK